MAPGGWILLVEDDHDVREALLGALDDQGYTVTGAIDGVDALERLRSSATVPELVVTDLTMPRMNGFELREALRRAPQWAAIPVLFISADANARRMADVLEAAGFLKKPLHLPQLVAEVQRLVRRVPGGQPA